MSKITKRYETKLQSAERESITAILDAKLEATSPERVADYISLGIDNLESQIARMKDAEEELKAMRTDAQCQIDLIKIGSTEWLKESGINKLSGDIVSSVSIYEAEPEEKLIVIDEESLINAGYFKTTLDKTAVKNALRHGFDIEGAKLEIIHKENSLKINRRRKK